MRQAGVGEGKVNTIIIQAVPRGRGQTGHAHACCWPANGRGKRGVEGVGEIQKAADGRLIWRVAG